MTDHTHAHGHNKSAHARTLLLALLLTGTFLVVEVVAGVLFSSLALISDAAHMFTDAAALAIALAGVRIGRRPADERRTFGYRRFEIIAAAFNAVLLFAVAISVVVEGVGRFVSPVPVQSVGMFVVAALGLVINLVSIGLLSAGKDQSLNVKGAYLEVWADMIGSLAVLIAAGVIWFTGWQWVDPLAAIGIGLWVVPRTWTLLRESADILLESAPRGVNLAELRASLADVPGVAGVHDLHVWVSGADLPSCAAHIVVIGAADGVAVQRAIQHLLEQRFGLRHVTIQIERAPCNHAATHA